MPSGQRSPNASPPVSPPAIELRGISRAFGPVQANREIDLSVMPGTIHGIIGENGAGKSTLVSILYGFYQADEGEILIDGRRVDIHDSQAAIAAGIGMVFQHFKLVENFTVLENIILGSEKGALLRPVLAKARRELMDIEREYELEAPPDAKIEDLSIGQRQRVEILKALYRQARVLILDEPTGVLTPAEADRLFAILRRLRSEGKTIILITHKLREIMEVTDTVSVMRQGRMLATVATAATDIEELAERMVGRKVSLQIDKPCACLGDTLLEVENLHIETGTETPASPLAGIDFSLRAGEILGIAGVAGNGQSELLEVLAGYRRAKGSVRIKGCEVALSGSGIDAGSRRAAGLAHIPEDRQGVGLVMGFSVEENAILGYHRSFGYGTGALMDRSAIRSEAKRHITQFDIRPPDPGRAARDFSGGNQQKIVVAREIGAEPDILLIGQPTRGVDIGAIEFIHRRIIALRDAGKAILLVSVELEEILSLADRIMVMFGGRIMGERPAKETDERELGLLMAGVV
ncbi:ABC transporter ATP-binding protein [Thioalkalivibrio sp. HK1]|uniref:ABC transporter ATP-binding protein n=1 Tax=Thioalkalivibrio sp. HK1 TaxID=1469245 RepID=UPI0006852AF4|nr:ABC transporter ATP-binding protein [Thioalkalivibrio sp. HK1]